ncbi:MAG TPA: hypothetical protein VKS25_13900 [Solirubrobacteraceae bacterium]|nr:hypothetical protein [Solirubrobacteraceae bacterium]
MREEPESGHEAADERRIAELLRAVEARAPATLHAFTEQLVADRQPRTRSPRRRRRIIIIDSLALAGAAVAVVLALVFGTGNSPPTAIRTARIALASANGPAPRTLVAAGTTITFPDWTARGWPTSGSRSDRLGGRTVTTEYYRAYPAASEAIGYSIVSGAPVSWGKSGRVVARNHGDYILLESGGANIVAWVQEGHTCVLASKTASDATLLQLAVAQDGDPSTVSNTQGYGPAAPPV